MTLEIKTRNGRLSDWFPVTYCQYYDEYKSAYIYFDIKSERVRERLRIMLGAGETAVGALRCENKNWYVETKNTHRHLDKPFLFGEVLDSNGEFSQFLLHP